MCSLALKGQSVLNNDREKKKELVEVERPELIVRRESPSITADGGVKPSKVLH